MSYVVFRVGHEGIRKLAVTRQAAGIVPRDSVRAPVVAAHGECSIMFR